MGEIEMNTFVWWKLDFGFQRIGIGHCMWDIVVDMGREENIIPNIKISNL